MKDSKGKQEKDTQNRGYNRKISKPDHRTRENSERAQDRRNLCTKEVYSVWWYLTVEAL